jgi:hypothetical protein
MRPVGFGVAEVILDSRTKICRTACVNSHNMIIEDECDLDFKKIFDNASTESNIAGTRQHAFFP